MTKKSTAKLEIGPDRILVVLAGLRDHILSDLTDAYRRVGVADVTPPHGAVLCALRANRSFSIQELAAKVYRDQSTVSALVGHLVKRGYVTRKTSPNDKRMRVVALTPAGSAVRARVTRAARNMQIRLYRGFDASERQLLMSMLGRLGVNSGSPLYRNDRLERYNPSNKAG